MVKTWLRLISKIANDRKGQDLVEYAMLAAFVAVAAGAIFPASLMPNISTIFSTIGSMMTAANTFG